MDIKWLHYYVTVCDMGKMTQAAEKLFISKQALSSMMQRIEEEAGAQLLLRTRLGVKMTPEGRCFYEYAQQILQLWRQTMDSVAESGRAKRVQLRVGFGYLSYNLWSKEAEEAFLRENPDVELQIIDEVSNKLAVRLEEKQIDLMITGVATDELRKRYRCEMIASGDKRLWMMKNDELARYKQVCPDQMRERVVYCFEADRAYMMRFLAYMQEQGVGFEPKFMPSGNILASVRALQEEHALLMLSEMLCRPLEQIVGLTSRVLIDATGRKAPGGILSAVMPRDFQEMDAAMRFVRFLSRIVKRSMDSIAGHSLPTK